MGFIELLLLLFGVMDKDFLTGGWFGRSDLGGLGDLTGRLRFPLILHTNKIIEL